MIEVELVVAALTAGAAAGITDTASAAVRDGYEGLKSLTRKALRRGKPADERGDLVVEERLADPVKHRDELVIELTAADAGQDAELVAAARRVLDLTDPRGARAGNYILDVHDNQGVQIGDGNSMTLHLGT